MDYKIIVDSCGELTDEMKESGVYSSASLSMQVDGVTIPDDETFCQGGFPETSCLPVRNVRSHHVRHRRNIWNCTAATRKEFMR